MEQLKGLKIRIKVENGFLRRIGHWQEDKWLFCSEYSED